MVLVIELQDKIQNIRPVAGGSAFVRPGRIEKTRAVKGRPVHKNRVSEFVDNPQALATYDAAASAPVITPTVQGMAAALASPNLVPPGNYQYVIITASAFESAFQPLINHKASKGLTARSVNTEWIYANYDGTRPDGGQDNQTKIRNFIIDAYENWGTEYVLLGGDADGANVGGESGNNIVPVRCLRQYYNGDAYNIAADMYYGCLDGSFDADGDGIYGELTDGVNNQDIDLVSEVYVGRAPVDSVQEINNFINNAESCNSLSSTTSFWAKYRVKTNRMMAITEATTP